MGGHAAGSHCTHTSTCAQEGRALVANVQCRAKSLLAEYPSTECQAPQRAYRAGKIEVRLEAEGRLVRTAGMAVRFNLSLSFAHSQHRHTATRSSIPGSEGESMHPRSTGSGLRH